MVYILHSLTLSLSGTSALILALRGVEGVAQRDVQTVVAAHLALCHLITATTHAHVLNATLQHVADAGTQTERIILQPTFLNHEPKTIGGRLHVEVDDITLGLDVHVRLQLPTVWQTESIVQVDEEDRLRVSLLDLACF